MQKQTVYTFRKKYVKTNSIYFLGKVCKNKQYILFRKSMQKQTVYTF
jgi:hypothetical protein